MIKGQKIFGVWILDEDDSEDGYWDYYSTLADAVSAHGDGTEVWVVEPKLLGKFKRQVKMVREKKRKKRRTK